MTDNNWGWVDDQEEKAAEERSKDYFTIKDGDNRFLLLSHFAPLAQIYDPTTKKYHIAEEGQRGASIKGICWVLQDNMIKLARMPYTVVKQVRDLRDNPDWDFAVPFLHPLILKAKGAGTKEVEYSLQPSPKAVEVPASIIDELAKKPTPEEMVEKIKQKAHETSNATPTYPEDEITPDDIPF